MKTKIALAGLIILFWVSNCFAASTLIFPRIVSGNGWQTRISVRSLSTVSTGSVSVEVFNENGVVQESNTVALPADYVIHNNVTGWARVTVLANLANIDIDGSAVLQDDSSAPIAPKG